MLPRRGTRVPTSELAERFRRRETEAIRRSRMWSLQKMETRRMPPVSSLLRYCFWLKISNLSEALRSVSIVFFKNFCSVQRNELFRRHSWSSSATRKVIFTFQRIDSWAMISFFSILIVAQTSARSCASFFPSLVSSSPFVYVPVFHLLLWIKSETLGFSFALCSTPV